MHNKLRAILIIRPSCNLLRIARKALRENMFLITPLNVFFEAYEHVKSISNSFYDFKFTCCESGLCSEVISLRPNSRNKTSIRERSAATSSCARASAALTALCTSATAALRTSLTASSGGEKHNSMHSQI